MCDFVYFGYVGDFNSHAHVERDVLWKRYCNRATISTHTLTWSVTSALTQKLDKQIISTHTLTWSVTGHVILDPSEKPISTHTLTWSVTYTVVECDKCKKISTHTLTWSVTLTCIVIVTLSVFQLTRSRGA